MIQGASYMEARLRPLNIKGVQSCLEFSLETVPVANIFRHDQPEQMGSVSHFVLRNAPHDSLTIHAESVVETLITNPYSDVNLIESDWPLIESGFLRDSMPEWLSPTPMVELNQDWAVAERPGQGSFQYGIELMDKIHRKFQYTPGATDTTTTLAEFVAHGMGVCQDYAHYMLAVSRMAGIPARYVSGYVYSGNEGNVLGGDAMHAWVELFLPGVGIWKGFDPTNNIIVGDRHIKIAVGRDYSDVPPTRGVIRGDSGMALPEQSHLDVMVQILEVQNLAVGN